MCAATILGGLLLGFSGRDPSAKIIPDNGTSLPLEAAAAAIEPIPAQGGCGHNLLPPGSPTGQTNSSTFLVGNASCEPVQAVYIRQGQQPQVWGGLFAGATGYFQAPPPDMICFRYGTNAYAACFSGPAQPLDQLTVPVPYYVRDQRAGR
jgi:hypothetical protein